jgi:hypothetical protein
MSRFLISAIEIVPRPSTQAAAQVTRKPSTAFSHEHEVGAAQPDFGARGG